MADHPLAFASITEIGKLFRKRKLSPVELAKLHLDRIEALNPKLNAFLAITPELALAQARTAEKELQPKSKKSVRDRGPLHGIPISLKDNIFVKGVRATAGSKILEKFVPLHDATIVEALREAGSVFLGKTHMHEFAYGVTTNNPHFGPARNPYDISRSPGGSSGGSAAAVAAGIGYASIGTDTGGSVRIPAAICGVVGLKTTHGLISVDGIIPLSPKLDCVGPIARSVLDAALVGDALLSRSKKEKSYAASVARKQNPKKLVLGIPREFFFDVLADEVAYNFGECLAQFRKLGIKTKEVSIPLLNNTEDAGNQIAWAEATHYHQQAGWYPHHATQYGEDVRSRLEIGTKIAATNYLQALEDRLKFIQQLHHVLMDSEVDALAVPTTPIAAPLIGEEKTPIEDQTHPTRALLLRLNRPANLAGVPAISIPCGITKAGLPLGLQLIGAISEEASLLRIARIWESSAKPLPPPVL